MKLRKIKWAKALVLYADMMAKKIVIEHLYKAIATMRSQQSHKSANEQVQRVVEILERDFGVSVPDNLHKTIGRRIREFNAGQ